ncbi:MAG: hypothetical protein EPO65_08270 [Dehalococcoidia bacterium]|nr:MAG: hypothetical protein EPO65_08270 [Dehalococcoidia bacterium]
MAEAVPAREVVLMPAADLASRLAAIEASASTVRSHIENAETEARWPAPVLELLLEQRLFRLWLPRNAGGDELDLMDSLTLMEAASRVDGSYGWTVMIGSGGGLFGAIIEAPTAREMLSPREAVIAGSGAPRGRADIVEGGYRASGRWRYASGAAHATWFTANCVLHRDGAPVLDAAGAPVIRAMSFPPADVTIHRTWDVSGMRATGSEDFSVQDAFVPARRTFSVSGDAHHEAGPLYRFPFASITQAGVAAVALGIAAHAVEAYAALGRSADATVHARFGEAVAGLVLARAGWWEVTRDAWGIVDGGNDLDAVGQARVILACTHAAREAAAVVDVLHDIGGMAAMSDSGALGRCWRDVHAVTQHASLSPANYAAAGATLLEAMVNTETPR